MQAIVKSNNTKRRRGRPFGIHSKLTKYCRRPLHLYDLKLLDRYRMETGISIVQVANMIKDRFGNEAMHKREVYAILNGERQFPRPEYVKQIADVLEVPLKELITENKNLQTA